MSRYIFDCETNGLLDQLDRLHCLTLKDIDTGTVYDFADQPGYSPISEGIQILQNADEIVGHNVIGFDVPAIQLVYPTFLPKGKVTDTIVMTRLIYSNIKDIDFYKTNKSKQRGETYVIAEAKLYGSHGLKAWGLRMGTLKGDYDGGWDHWSEDMHQYCIQDVEVTYALYGLLLSKSYSEEAIQLEHNVATLMFKQEQNGFTFDVDAADALYKKLSVRRAEILDDLRTNFGIWFKPIDVIETKRTARRKNSEGLVEGYTKGLKHTKVVCLSFNPASRDQIADRFITKYGWEPKEFTDSGKPKVDETVLAKLNYPEAHGLAEYMMLVKRCGQLYEGSQGWLKKVKDDGRIHGRVNTNSTVTGRASHTSPNVAQVPTGKKPYGTECRSLFTVPKGWTLVGSDMAGLELRVLAHFLAKYDNGKYVDLVLDGDVHTHNQKAAGLPDRSTAKLWVYATLYGAGPDLLGEICGGGRKDGLRSKRMFMKNVPALKRLNESIKAKLNKQSEANQSLTVKGLDGRTLYVRSKHSCLNLILQSSGALLCKKWLTLLDQYLQEQGLVHGWEGDYAFCAWIHDEVQLAVKNGKEDTVGEICRRAAEDTGTYFKFRCPVTADYSTGRTWAETH